MCVCTFFDQHFTSLKRQQQQQVTKTYDLMNNGILNEISILSWMCVCVSHWSRYSWMCVCKPFWFPKLHVCIDGHVWAKIKWKKHSHRRIYNAERKRDINKDQRTHAYMRNRKEKRTHTHNSTSIHMMTCEILQPAYSSEHFIQFANLRENICNIFCLR